MSGTEAIKTLDILLAADMRCPVCSAELFKLFIKNFPKFEDLALTVWQGEHGSLSDFRHEQDY